MADTVGRVRGGEAFAGELFLQKLVDTSSGFRLPRCCCNSRQSVYYGLGLGLGLLTHLLGFQTAKMSQQ